MSIRNYRELVQSMIATHHTELEIGLIRVREQEAFVNAVAKLLDEVDYPYRIRMDRNFCVTFLVKWVLRDIRKQLEEVGKQLCEEHDVWDLKDRLDVCDRRRGYSCTIVFGDLHE